MKQTHSLNKSFRMAGSWLTVALIAVASVSPDTVSPSQDVELLWDLDKAHLFDSATGQAIR